VALYGSSYALSQLAGPLLLGFLGTEHDYGFWVGVGLLMVAPLLLLGRSGAPSSRGQRDLRRPVGFCRELPAIAWAVSLFAAFEAMILTLLPVYCLQQGFTAEIALAMVSTVVVGDACCSCRSARWPIACRGARCLPGARCCCWCRAWRFRC
jgi:MFS family permease